MNTNLSHIKSVKITNGRAFRWSGGCLRWMPMKMADAEFLIATGAVEDCSGEEF